MSSYYSSFSRIFSLQRVRTLGEPLPVSIAKETQSRFDQINGLFNSLAGDIVGINAWRYLRQLSWGIQEYVEAASFRHYLLTGTLISLEEVAASLPAHVLLTEEDYLMGLFDLTGEMMRFAITTLSAGALATTAAGTATGDARPPSSAMPTTPAQDAAATQHSSQEQPDTEAGLPRKRRRVALQLDRTDEPTADTNPTISAATGTVSSSRLPPSHSAIVVDLRAMRSFSEALSVPDRHFILRDLSKKLDVMQTSVEKVERAAYGILVRGSERPSGWMPDLTGTAELESF